MTARRDWTVIGCVLLVALATVTASFTAQSGLGELAGWTTVFHVFGVEVAMSWLLPITVDAYGIAATRIATDKARYSAEVRGHAFGHALAAVVVSVLGNAMFHLIEAEVIVLGGAAWVLVVAVSVVPPIALGGLAHLLGVAARDEVEAVAVSAAAPLEAADPVDEMVVERLPVDPAAPGTAGLTSPIGEVIDVPAIPAPSPAPTPVLTPAPDELFPVAADRYAAEIAEGQAPAVSRLKRDLKIGQPRAVKIKAYLDQLAEAKPTPAVRGQDAEEISATPTAPSRKITEEEEALRVMDLAVEFTKENPPTEADLEADGLDETAKFIVRKAWNMPDPKQPAEDSERPWDGPWGDEPTDEELTAGMTPAEIFAGPPIKVLRQQWREREWRNRTAAMNGHGPAGGAA
ncbi:hypothetical protein ACFV1N_46810 [Streptosporangium canum]|uniref:hypothetical protein n=1 Tax=Streptosporangium canum TaxID=324952 RepID=UPI0036C8F5CB